MPDLIRYLVRAAGRDANFLLNVGPRPDGTLDPESVERLEGIGKWLAKYGPTIYGTRGGPIAPQPWGVSTQTDDTIYLHVLDRSKAGDDGWLTLSGTEDLTDGNVSRSPTAASRRSPQGRRRLLQVKLRQVRRRRRGAER